MQGNNKLFPLRFGLVFLLLFFAAQSAFSQSGKIVSEYFETLLEH